MVELGGQDAKIIIFKEDPETGRKKKIPSMNDKCAGGTGAVIDKINAKVKIPAEKLCEMGYIGLKLHPVAGKCGVFAETDINGLQKSGVPPAELMASLFEAIVMQNLSVLTRGNTLRPEVLLLGGPNTYIKGMQECWRYNIPRIWEERKIELPAGVEPASLIKVPDNAQYFAAIGAVEYGKTEDDCVGCYHGYEKLDWYVNVGREEEKKKKGGNGGLAKTDDELRAFVSKYTPEEWEPTRFRAGEVVEGFIGVDGGSTSTKAVLLSKDKSRRVIAKAYQLSKGNPIEDTMEIFAKLEEQVKEQGATLKVLGVGSTGYAKDILRDVIGADAAVVETVAHTQAGLHFYDNADVICDVGGQDIKIIILKNGRVKDFKLNTQCSAGNGYFLQSTSQGFGYQVEEFADVAFGAKGFPQFGYGCAVFMQMRHRRLPAPGMEAGRDHGRAVQRAAEKHLAVRVADSQPGGDRAKLPAAGRHAEQPGRRKVAGGLHRVALQGQGAEAGRHRSRVLRRGGRHRRGAGGRPPVSTTDARPASSGSKRCRKITYTTTRNEDHPLLLLQEQVPAHLHRREDIGSRRARLRPKNSKVPLAPGVAAADRRPPARRAPVEDIGDMREIKGGLDKVKEANPNFAEIGAKCVFRAQDPPAGGRSAAAVRGSPRQQKKRARS